MEKSISAASALMIDLVDGLEKVIKGKRSFLELLVTGFVAGGHVLIEDLPGMGKTTVAKTLAHLVGGSAGGSTLFSRIQFTPDLLPYDITGVDVFDPESSGFVFHPGPVFANIVLADEINRTTPKVQSALLEVMAEGQVSIGNKTHQMDDLFFLIATQNPIETEGTYPLPAAQLDRFMLRLSLGYPDLEDEIAIVEGNPGRDVMPYIEPVCTKEDVLAARQIVDNVYCNPDLIRSTVTVSAETRSMGGIDVGISPRGNLMLIQAARTLALLRGRDFVVDQDLADLCGPALIHRLKIKDSEFDIHSFLRDALVRTFKRV